jgi:hemerythrin-like domain-containing protein
MVEHRLIEKMIEVMKQKVSEIEEAGEADTDFIDTVVDFIRTYADRTHHGKEENILFYYCEKKVMTREDTKVMHELEQEHEYTRKIVRQLVEAKENYIKGKDTLNTLLEKLNILIDLYPPHISKEDKNFFLKSEKYFTEAELQKMLVQFRDFDSKMIHEKYKSLVEELKSKT